MNESLKQIITIGAIIIAGTIIFYVYFTFESWVNRFFRRLWGRKSRRR